MGDSSNKLFKADSDWKNNACLNFTEDRWDLYAEGYKKASDLLVTHIQINQVDQDFLVYPIVFNYRQYLELKLKDILLVAQKVFNKTFILPIHHDINMIWKDVREIIEQNWSDTPKKDLNQVGKLINEFSNADKISMAFRYPIDKSGDVHLKNICHINLRNLKEHIENISTLLDNVFV